MFICEECIKKYEGPAIDIAKSVPFRSVGKCEVCEIGKKRCYDIPSRGNWRLKSAATTKIANRKP